MVESSCMQAPVLLVTLNLPGRLLHQIEEAAGPDFRVVAVPTEAEALPLMSEVVVLIPGVFTPAMLAAGSRLRWVQTGGAGVDGVLFPELIASDVLVTNARGAHRFAMSEFVLMAMLTWGHNFPALFRAQLRHEWIQPLSNTIVGKTLGLLGYGAIGHPVAVQASHLGVRCIALRRHPERSRSESPLAACYGPDQLHEFLAACDFVVNSLPNTAETRGIVDEAALRAMKPTAVLINLGRGPTTDERALLAALQEGWIAGAYLDVFEQEPLRVDSPFWDLPNAIITNHTSGNSLRYQEWATEIACENIRRYRAGEPVKQVVDKHLGY